MTSIYMCIYMLSGGAITEDYVYFHEVINVNDCR